MADKRLRNQNILDFVLNKYGTLESLGSFVKDNSITDLRDFEFIEEFNVDTVTPSDELSFISSNGVQISTGKTDIELDFNDDFNNDFG
jgi:hypothetical protein